MQELAMSCEMALSSVRNDLGSCSYHFHLVVCLLPVQSPSRGGS